MQQRIREAFASMLALPQPPVMNTWGLSLNRIQVLVLWFRFYYLSLYEIPTRFSSSGQQFKVKCHMSFIFLLFGGRGACSDLESCVIPYTGSLGPPPP